MAILQFSLVNPIPSICQCLFAAAKFVYLKSITWRLAYFSLHFMKYSISFQTMLQGDLGPRSSLRGLPLADALSPTSAPCSPRARSVWKLRFDDSQFSSFCMFNMWNIHIKKRVIIFCRGSHTQHCAGQDLLCPSHFPHTAQGTCTGRQAVIALLLSSKKSSWINLVIAIQDDAALWFPVASYHMEGKGNPSSLQKDEVAGLTAPR